MKLFISLIIMICFSHVCFGQEILTNNTIEQLIKLNLSTTIIVNKIETSKNRFNVSTDSLIQLKTDKVPDDVVNAMIKAASNVNNIVTDINDPNQYHQSGIYYYKNNNGAGIMSELEPAVVSQNKTRGLWGYAFTGGISSASTDAVLPGENAHFQIYDKEPVFYFYFNVQQENLTVSTSTVNGSYFGKATSPNEFILIKSNKRNNGREFSMNSVNASGAQSGVKSKNEVGFQMQKISDGMYKVYFNSPLESGEYAFMYAGINAGSTGSSTLFDFGIPKYK